MEYSGYGASSGRTALCRDVFEGRMRESRRPSSGNSYADVEAAYEYLVEKRGLPPKRS